MSINAHHCFCFIDLETSFFSFHRVLSPAHGARSSWRTSSSSVMRWRKSCRRRALWSGRDICEKETCVVHIKRCLMVVFAANCTCWYVLYVALGESSWPKKIMRLNDKQPASLGLIYLRRPQIRVIPGWTFFGNLSLFGETMTKPVPFIGSSVFIPIFDG